MCGAELWGFTYIGDGAHVEAVAALARALAHVEDLVVARHGIVHGAVARRVELYVYKLVG